MTRHSKKHTKCDESENKIKHFTHQIQLQLADSLGFPVVSGACPGCTGSNCNGTDTTFWVELDIVKQGPLVTITLPVINFQTGQVSVNNPYCPDGIIFGTSLPPAGGYLYTSDGFLPEDIRPSDLVPRSIVAASNNGLSPIFSFSQDPSTLVQPPAGYIVQVRNDGSINIQCAGTFGNIIPAGPQILMPCSIQYVVKPSKKLCKNVNVSIGASNVTQFTSADALNVSYRDSQVNDTYNGITAWTWGDNSMVADKTNNVLNCVVAIGKVDSHGKLNVGTPIQLTNLNPPFSSTFDHAVAINRADPNNIVVSYVVFNRSDRTADVYCRAVSFDGGLTWPAPYDGITPQINNGPLSPQPPFGVGDARGIASDKYGNIWYSSNPATDDPAQFSVSVNKGVDFTLVYTVPLFYDPNVAFLDYPQYCFGINDQGQYGLYYTTQLENFVTADDYQVFGFIEIPGPLNLISDLPLTSSYTLLQGFTNVLIEPNVAASNDGRVWLGVQVSSANIGYPYTYIQSVQLAFKSPVIGGDIGVTGPTGSNLNLNWAGPWHIGMANYIGLNYGDDGLIAPGIPMPISQPDIGYFPGVVTGLIYDDTRQALYALLSNQTPDYSQNMRIYFIISRDNGMTWSAPININNTNFANRGFQSMALDTATGNLVFGWYDGRNDPTYQSVQYMAAVIPSKKLTKLVNAIPLSNPQFVVPSVESAPFVSNIAHVNIVAKRKRFGRK